MVDIFARRLLFAFALVLLAFGSVPISQAMESKIKAVEIEVEGDDNSDSTERNCTIDDGYACIYSCIAFSGQLEAGCYAGGPHGSAFYCMCANGDLYYMS